MRRVDANPHVRFPGPVVGPAPGVLPATSAIEWDITKTKADQV